MKKSKIIGLSLGLIGLSTIAVATPVVISSCSNDKGVINQETGYAEVTVQKTAVQFGCIFVMDKGQEVALQILNNILTDNTINCTTYNVEGLNLLLVLNTSVQSVLSQRDINAFNLDPNAKVEWSLKGWKTHNDNDNQNHSVGFATSQLNNNPNNKLIGKVGNIKFLVNININTIPLPIA